MWWYQIMNEEVHMSAFLELEGQHFGLHGRLCHGMVGFTAISSSMVRFKTLLSALQMLLRIFQRMRHKG